MEVKYHQDHTWVRMVGDVGIIGITDHAQLHLGEITYVELPEEGDELSAGEEFGQIESASTTSVLSAPVSGEVLDINEALNDNPSIINDAPYKEGWMIRVNLSDPSELDGLLTEEEYEEFVSEEE